MLARFGGVDSHPLHFGTDNEKFLGIGCMVGYAIIVPAILGTYLMGATHTFLVSIYFQISIDQTFLLLKIIFSSIQNELSDATRPISISVMGRSLSYKTLILLYVKIYS